MIPMSITGSDLIEVFKVVCESEGRLFIPDSPRQEDIADSIAKHYDSDDLLNAIKLYVKSEYGPILVFDFAIKSRDFVDKVKKERLSIDKFKQTVADTRKLIEEYEL
jgi:hypothetical protein